MWDEIVWFFDEFGIWFSETWNTFLGSFAYVIESIPVPDFLLAAGSITIPPSVAYFANGFNLDVGALMIVSSYTLRFFIRRLPVVG